MAAALAGSLMPANMGWVEPGQGVRIFVYSNGVHTGIVVPTANKVKDWRSLVRPNDLSDPRYAEDHLLFGWGERNFYLQTPSWSDLDLSVAARALIYRLEGQTSELQSLMRISYAVFCLENK